ncbi:unnamed protein product [Plasmodium vivax]|uniref:(malaria parasite P. vivax) hypothetical protein n=1 Tax=Plasmodium vivax TaxID=5855 RepID=A0A8S4HDX2_PLAVI|nr:unnamed protein product [Plasmodium vivax]CAI7719903.1 PIR protein [Plasmodium vivax]
MSFTSDKCKEFIGGFKGRLPMIESFEKLCACLDNTDSESSTNDCPCNDIKKNNETLSAFQSFSECFKKNETSSDAVPNTQYNVLYNLFPQQVSSEIPQEVVSSLPKSLFSSLPFRLPTALELLTNKCYTEKLRNILKLKEETTVCGVNVTAHKTKIETVINVLETLQTSTQYTLKSVRAVGSASIFAQKIFTDVILNLKPFEIAIPMCISLSVTVILILMFYKIYTGGPLFGRRKKKKKKRLDYDLDEETQFMPMPMAMPTLMPMAMPTPMPMPMAMPMAMPMPMPNDLSLGYQPLK